MHRYSIFGGCFASELPFPELRPHRDTAADWSLRLVERPPLAERGTPLGEDAVPGGMHVRLYRLADGFRLVYNDTGTFDVPDAGDRILWCRGAAADEHAARLDVIGYGFATLFHAADTLCLHGSGVELGSGGVAFIAPKHHGKSTLAQALTDAGARLLTDDSLPVILGPRPLARPGIHQVRLRSDAARHLNRGEPTAVDGTAGKHVVVGIEADRLVTEPITLNVIYVLSPAPADAGGPPVSREELSPMTATLALVRYTKGGLLLTGSESGLILERAAALARAVAVFRLRVVRDFNKLGAVVAQLAEWHGGFARLPALA